MAVERTLSIIKPDATARNITGKIISKFEDAGLRIIAQKRVHWDATDAASFYSVHKSRQFSLRVLEAAVEKGASPPRPLRHQRRLAAVRGRGDRRCRGEPLP